MCFVFHKWGPEGSLWGALTSRLPRVTGDWRIFMVHGSFPAQNVFHWLPGHGYHLWEKVRGLRLLMESFLSQRQWQMSSPPQFKVKGPSSPILGFLFSSLKKNPKLWKSVFFCSLLLRFCRDDIADKSKSHSALSCEICDTYSASQCQVLGLCVGEVYWSGCF